MWAVWRFVAGVLSLALGYHFSSIEFYIWGALFISWPLLMVGETLAKPDSNKYQKCLINTARMEIECYGLIVSQSVEWWLADTGSVLCQQHPFPDLPVMVTGHRCTCPGQAPPNPGTRSGQAKVKVHSCTSTCPHDSITDDKGDVMAVYCTISGKLWGA